MTTIKASARAAGPKPTPNGPVSGHARVGTVLRKPIRRSTAFAFAPFVMALQYRQAAVRHAVGTQEVRFLAAVTRFFFAVNDRSEWGFPEFVAVKLSVKTMRVHQRVYRIGQTVFKIGIRQLRVRYLHRKVGDQRFDLKISGALRRIEKRLDVGQPAPKGSQRTAQFGGQAGGLLEDVDPFFQRFETLVARELHHLHFNAPWRLRVNAWRDGLRAGWAGLTK